MVEVACRYFPDKFISRRWKSYSKLMIVEDGEKWVFSEISKELARICATLNIEVIENRYRRTTNKQCLFFVSKEVLKFWHKFNHRVAFPYFHGDPKLDNKFSPYVASIRKNHERISRIQVSCTSVENLVLNTGIDPSKVFKIPISIDPNLFQRVNPSFKRASRQKYGVPNDALVIGSFQKDGIGMGAGDAPKLIKGPDIFLNVLEILKQDYDELFVLLSGLARGYVKTGLEKLGIPYKDLGLVDYREICDLYHALDLYIVASREEGGPRAVLESMAAGIPLVSTRVGQAVDLVRHGENGWLADVGHVEEIAWWSKYVIENSGNLGPVINEASETSKQNNYESQLGLWRQFMSGFVEQK